MLFRVGKAPNAQSTFVGRRNVTLGALGNDLATAGSSFRTASEKLEAFRRHAEMIAGSGMTEERAWKVYRDSGISEIAIARDWYIFLSSFDPMELPRVPDYSIVKPFKLFCGEIVADGRGRDLGACYITSYLRFFDGKLLPLQTRFTC